MGIGVLAVPVGGLGLQRLFTAFPNGSRGIALLLLRAVVGGTAIAEGVTCLLSNGTSALMQWAIALLMLASGIALEIGILTPVAAAAVTLANLAIVGSWITLPASSFSHDLLAVAFFIVMAANTCILGPGAYSLDARMFGRREIIIPAPPPCQEP